MTNERNKRCSDELVSAVYRESAKERVPQHLNERILKLATETDSRESRSRTLLSFWTKPLAWAAAVSLCVVVAFESTQQAETVSDRFVPRDLQTIDDATNRAGYQDGPSGEQYPSAGSTRTDVEAGRACVSNERLTADAWLNCIRELREQNRSVDAEREYASFILKYPAPRQKPELKKK